MIRSTLRIPTRIACFILLAFSVFFAACETESKMFKDEFYGNKMLVEYGEETLFDPTVDEIKEMGEPLWRMFNFEFKSRDALKAAWGKYEAPPLLSSRFVKTGQYAALLKPGSVKMRNFEIPKNWTEYTAIEFWMHSQAANDQQVTIVLYTAPAGVWGTHQMSFVVNWTGWKKMSIPISESAFSKRGKPVEDFSFVRGFEFSLTEGGAELFSDTELHVDAIKLVPIDYSTMGEMLVGGEGFAEGTALVLPQEGGWSKYTAKETIPVEGMAFTEAVRVRVTKDAKRPEDVALSLGSFGRINKGERLKFRCFVRTPDADAGLITLALTTKGENPTHSYFQRVKTGSNWMIVEENFTAETTHSLFNSELVAYLGHHAQTLEIGGVELIRYGKNAEVPVVQFGTTIRDIDLTEGKGIIPLATKAPKRIKGVMADGFEDNSDWAQIWIDYSYSTYDPMGGTAGFLNCKITKKVNGRGTLRFEFDEPKTKSYYLIQTRLRSYSQSPVTIMIRQMGAPYRSYWSKTVALNMQWQDFAFDIELEPTQTRVGLYIQWMEGEFDMQKFKMLQKTETDLVSEASLKYPEGGPNNLLRTTRFPLGRQQGWNFKLYNRVKEGKNGVRFDKSVPTFDGKDLPVFHAKLPGWRVHRFRTSPFRLAYPFKQHTVSFYVRGEIEKGQVMVHADKNIVAMQEFAGVKGEWTRIELPFMPALMGQYHIIEIKGKGEFYLDAFQVNEGTKATPYALPLGAEVSMNVDQEAPVQFYTPSGKEAVVKYAVLTEEKDTVLKAKVFNLYNEEKALPDVPLKNQFINKGTFRYDVFPEHPLGAHRIEAWVVSKDGNVISPVNEFVVHRVRKPRFYGKHAPESRFGIHSPLNPRFLYMSKAIGMNWIRLHEPGSSVFAWKVLQPEKDEPWRWQDETIELIYSNNFEIVGVLQKTPHWARHLEKDRNRWKHGYFVEYIKPINEYWLEYVKTIVERYKGKVRAYDIWNEPWGHYWWDGFDDSKTSGGEKERLLHPESREEDYAEFNKITYEAIKEVDPDADVLAVDATYGGGGMGGDWMAEMVARDVEKYGDQVVFHAYHGDGFGHMLNQESWWCGSVYSNVFKPLRDKYDGKLPKPVWMTEGGPTVGRSLTGLYNHISLGNTETALDNWTAGTRIAEYYLALISYGTEKFFPYSLHTYAGFEGGPEKNRWKAIVAADGELSPEGSAHSAFAWNVDGLDYVGRFSPKEKVHIFLFEGKGRSLAVVAGEPGHADYMVVGPNSDIRVYDLYGNPVTKASKLAVFATYVSSRLPVAELRRKLE